MAIASAKIKKTTSANTRKTVYSSNTDDINVLKKIAEEKGLDIKEKKPSLFRRTIDVISRPLYASAGAAKAIAKNLDSDQANNENVLKEAWKGFKSEEKETYSDVLETLGVRNKFVKGGVGFALDVALDPTTYFGGTAIKYGLKGLGKVAKPIGKALEAINPESMAKFKEAGKNLKDAFGTAFKYGYGTSKGLSDDVSVALNKIGMAKEDIIDANVKMFGDKVDPKKVERAVDLMIENRRIEKAARKTGEKTIYKYAQNPETNAILKAMKDKGKEIAKKGDIKDGYEWYFPFLRKDKLAKGADKAGILKVGQEGYKKEFRDLIQDENLLKKPFEAYSRREFEVVRDGMTRQTLGDMVEAYGKPLNAFKNADEAIEAGYTPIKDKRFGKAVGYLKETDAKFINDYLFPEFKTIDTLAKGVGYDKFTNTFKTAVTAYFPAFHIRNYISGNVQNYQVLGARALAPANVPTALAVLKGANKTVKLGGKTYNTQALNKVMKENFEGASRYISDIGNYIEEISSNNFKLNKISSARKIGNFVEMNQKAVAMITGLKQGKTIKEAVKLAEKAGFDYSKITKFESKVMKRLVPFYTFARKNASLQLSTFKNNPERILNQAKLADALSNVFGSKVTEDDMAGLPPWVLEGLGFKVKGDKYVSQLGLPLEEFIGRINNPIMSTLSSLNPIVKYPLEAKMGYDFFREQEITDINKLAPASGEMLIRAKEKGLMPEWLDNALNVDSYVSTYDGKTKYTMSPKALHILRNIPTSRFQNTLEKIFDKDLEKINKFMAFFSGGKVYDIDVETQKFFTERDLRRDIEDQLLERGVGSKFEAFNIYK